MPKKTQVKLRKIKDPEDATKFIAEEVHIYDGPRGSGSIHFMFRLNGNKMEYKAIHEGLEIRPGLPVVWTELDETDVDTLIRKKRIVTKIIIERDFSGTPFEVVKDDFEEAYFEIKKRANPHPARAVIEDK